MLAGNVKVFNALNPATITATTNGIAVDMQGYESIAFDIAVGSFATFDGTNKWTFTVQEGDLADSSDMATIPTADYLGPKTQLGADWDRVCDAATDDEVSFMIPVAKSKKRYRRIVLTEAGTVSAICAVTALLGKARHNPAGATQTP